MQNKILFNFDGMTGKDAATQEAKRFFSRAGAKVVEADATGGVKRVSGVSYRELRLVFVDGQTVTLRIKQTGDIYQILVNDRAMPIKNQDDHAKAIEEIVKVLDSGRAAFQKKLAATLVKMPPGIRTAAPKMESILIERRDSLKESIAAANEKLAGLRQVPETPTAEDGMKSKLKAFATATNNELFDPDYREGEWMVEAEETQETLEQWEESSRGWSERTAMKSGALAGFPFRAWKSVQTSKGQPRQSMSVIDFGTVRYAINTDLTNF